jgi:YD repeat-containing protein
VKTDATGALTTYTIDTNGKIISEFRPEGFLITYGYDVNGFQNAVQMPYGFTTSLVFDSNKLPQVSYDALGNATTYQYSAALDLTTLIDSAGSVWTQVFDSSHNVLARVDPLGRRMTMTYDSFGLLTYADTSPTLRIDPSGKNASVIGPGTAGGILGGLGGLLGTLGTVSGVLAGIGVVLGIIALAAGVAYLCSWALGKICAKVHDQYSKDCDGAGCGKAATCGDVVSKVAQIATCLAGRLFVIAYCDFPQPIGWTPNPIKHMREFCNVVGAFCNCETKARRLGCPGWKQMGVVCDLSIAPCKSGGFSK